MDAVEFLARFGRDVDASLEQVRGRYGITRDEYAETVRSVVSKYVFAKSAEPVQDGVVTYAGWESGYGLEVRIDHGGGITTLYAHMARSFVAVGQRVAQGEGLGTVGSTGRVSAPHLHFEVRVGGVPQNPMRWLGGA